ncbi:MAG: hypothetical protein NZ811_05045 [Gammaproteobacteria bacterium]|nr:hypothetical protein [Gammaproteobacteria bacterium]
MSSREIMNSMNGKLNGKSNTDVKSYKFRDPVVRRVCDKFVERSDIGYAKYGRTLHAERTGGHKDLVGYLNDIQEELMDAILYIQAAREEIGDEMDRQYEKTLSRENQ